jgi:hypothetical protein
VLEDLRLQRRKPDVGPKVGRPRTLNDPSQVLALVLNFLNSTMSQKTLCQIFGAAPAIISRELWDGMAALNATLEEMPEATVEFPSCEKIKHFAQLVRTRYPELPRDLHIYSMLDGSSFPCADFTDSLKQVSYHLLLGNAHACFFLQLYKRVVNRTPFMTVTTAKHM